MKIFLGLKTRGLLELEQISPNYVQKLSGNEVSQRRLTQLWRKESFCSYTALLRDRPIKRTIFTILTFPGPHPPTLKFLRAQKLIRTLVKQGLCS